MSNFRIYYNLHKKCWSVQERSANGWRVSRHESWILAFDCKFKISGAGRKRAFIECQSAAFKAEDIDRIMNVNKYTKYTRAALERRCRVSYSPYDDNGWHVSVPSFRADPWLPKDITEARVCYLQDNGKVFAAGISGYRIDAESEILEAEIADLRFQRP